MDGKPLPDDLSKWLPMPGAFDIVVVAVQECNYKLRPRSVDWLANVVSVVPQLSIIHKSEERAISNSEQFTWIPIIPSNALLESRIPFL
eukprot:1195250-Prorocentrum_minimum.AAC.6